MAITIATFIYVLSIPLWLLVWYSATGFRLMRHNPLLIIPFLLSLTYLAGNAILLEVFTETSGATYEEERIKAITDRAMIAAQAMASVLIVATIVYGLSIKRVPLHFIRFMVYSFIALLGVMAPILWIPAEQADLFFVLRHFQATALNFGLFLCVAGIIMLLRDLITHGDAQISLTPVDPMMRCHEESEETSRRAVAPAREPQRATDR